MSDRMRSKVRSPSRSNVRPSSTRTIVVDVVVETGPPLSASRAARPTCRTAASMSTRTPSEAPDRFAEVIATAPPNALSSFRNTGLAWQAMEIVASSESARFGAPSTLEHDVQRAGPIEIELLHQALIPGGAEAPPVGGVSDEQCQRLAAIAHFDFETGRDRLGIERIDRDAVVRIRGANHDSAVAQVACGLLQGFGAGFENGRNGHAGCSLVSRGRRYNCEQRIRAGSGRFGCIPFSWVIRFCARFEGCNRGLRGSHGSVPGRFPKTRARRAPRLWGTSSRGHHGDRGTGHGVRHPDTAACLRGLTDEEAAKQPPLVREQDGVAHYWREGGRVCARRRPGRRRCMRRSRRSSAGRMEAELRGGRVPDLDAIETWSLAVGAKVYADLLRRALPAPACPSCGRRSRPGRQDVRGAHGSACVAFHIWTACWVWRARRSRGAESLYADVASPRARPGEPQAEEFSGVEVSASTLRPMPGSAEGVRRAAEARLGVAGSWGSTATIEGVAGKQADGTAPIPSQGAANSFRGACPPERKQSKIPSDFFAEGGSRVIKLEKIVICELKREGLSISAIARRTGLDRKTVRKLLDRGLAAPAYSPREREPSRAISPKRSGTAPTCPDAGCRQIQSAAKAATRR